MSTPFDLEAATREFHETYALPLSDAPCIRAAHVELRESLLVEEFEEYCAAVTANDSVEIADALADMAYVLSGTGHVFGIRVDPTIGLDTTLAGALAAYRTAVAIADPDLVAIALGTVLRSVFAAARSWQIPLGAVLEEVHRSNMSKLGADGRPLYRADGKVLKGPGYFPPDIAAVLASAS